MSLPGHYPDMKNKNVPTKRDEMLLWEKKSHQSKIAVL